MSWVQGLQAGASIFGSMQGGTSVPNLSSASTGPVNIGGMNVPVQATMSHRQRAANGGGEALSDRLLMGIAVGVAVSVILGAVGLKK